MKELRKDYFTDTLVIISTERARRPSDFKHLEEPKTEGICPFCPGNESMTPPADLVLVQQNGSLMKLSDDETSPVKDWLVRAFPNMYPAVSHDTGGNYGDSPLATEPAYGYHYVIVATPDHQEYFSKISIDQWVNVLSALQDKCRWLYSQRAVSYVAIFINHGSEAGASLSHPHLQLITLPRLPPRIEQEASAVQKSMHELGVCPMCNVVNIESGGPRQIIGTDLHLAFSPWAPTHTFEFWIFPKKHQTSFFKATQREIKDLALILRASLGGLSRALNEPPFNLVFHISSEKKITRQIHWHIEVYPQLTKWAGLEKGSGIYIVQVPPEEAAQVLGAMARKELAELIGIT